MGAILRWIGLKIKTQRARALAFVRLKSCQLTDLVPCHHSRSFENKMLVLGPLDTSFDQKVIVPIMLEFIGNGGCAANTVARPLHRFADRLHVSAGDGRNFPE